MGKSMKNENEAIIRDEELRWLLNAIQEVAKTGIRPDGLYWRASYTPEDAAAVAAAEKLYGASWHARLF